MRQKGNTLAASTSGDTRPTALITGASSGIGVHFAKVLAGMGYNLLLVSNQEEAIRETASKIAVQYGSWEQSGEIQMLRIEGVCKNLATPNAAEELFELYPRVDVLINNAGIFIFQDVADCSLERIETLLNLHIVTVTKLCRLYGGQMRKAGKGYILNMSSVSAHTPFPGISLYTASKSYLRTFTKAFGYELKESGVRVMAVSPGAVATNLYNLPPHLQRLGMRLGIIYPPERLAKRGIKKLFQGKKEFVPGGINRFFVPVFKALPDGLIGWARRKMKRFMR